MMRTVLSRKIASCAAAETSGRLRPADRDWSWSSNIRLSLINSGRWVDIGLHANRWLDTSLCAQFRTRTFVGSVSRKYVVVLTGKNWLSLADVSSSMVAAKWSALVGRWRTLGLFIKRNAVKSIGPCLLAWIGSLFPCVWSHEYF